MSKHNGKQFIKYCKIHNKNICIKYENEHKNCETICFGDILPKENQLDCEQLKGYINKLKNEINEIINNLKYVMDNLEIYYNISKNIINNFNKTVFFAYITNNIFCFIIIIIILFFCFWY